MIQLEYSINTSVHQRYTDHFTARYSLRHPPCHRQRRVRRRRRRRRLRKNTYRTEDAECACGDERGHSAIDRAYRIC